MAEGPVGGVPGTLAAGVYRFVLERRNRAFDRGFGVRRLDVPVISVGNLSVGGTGKTPLVETIVRWVLDHSPCIAMRGYG
ncbi:MAG: tetraacyldisaccharide 4'-kinase, partial [Phycisphaerales bacterium]|nr:tetraacyldisaccharide 4'-kinase [Phycisphaerales bacterium]